MTSEKNFGELWQAYLNNTLPPEEYPELMKGVKSGLYDSFIKEQIDSLYTNPDMKMGMLPERAQEILLNIQLSEKQTSRLIRVSGTPVKKILIWGGVAASLVSVVAYLFFAGKETPRLYTKTEPNTKVVPIVVERKFINLPDGSTVILNDGSKLNYPDKFDGKTREVTLVGQAYFDIRHDASKPFIVHCGNVSTTVLGTAFDIKAYPGDNKIIVTVTRGRVKVSTPGKTLGIILPNQQIAVNTAKFEFSETAVDAASVVAWKEQYLLLNDISLEDAAILIGDRFHVKINFSNEAIKKCRITATFLNRESLEQVLKVVCGVVNASFVQQPNDKVIINGGNCQ